MQLKAQQKFLGEERKFQLLSFFFCAIVFLVFFFFTSLRAYHNPYRMTCEFAEKRLYLPPEKTKDWYDECLSRSRLAGAFEKTYRIVNDFNETTKRLEISHFSLFLPEVAANIWDGVEKSNGIKSQFVDGALVVFEVQPSSSAEKVGIRFGDIIQTIDKEAPSAEAANQLEGDFKILRDKQEMNFHLLPSRVLRDDSIYVRTPTNGSAVIQVPSFRPDYFSRADLDKMVLHAQGRRKIILDLRGNRGGSIVAGLRLLSILMCGPQEIGYFNRPRSRDFSEATLPDDLDDETQLSYLENNSLVRLRTFENYPCLPSSIVVLVDSGTGSTAEMVAQALRDYSGAKIYGVRSAGELLISVWHPLPWFPYVNGQQIRVSIPEALYQTKAGRVIEGAGVRPDKEYYYRLEDFKSGYDSWILKALNSF